MIIFWCYQNFDDLSFITYYLLTESEVITGKSLTEALMSWLSDGLFSAIFFKIIQ